MFLQSEAQRFLLCHLGHSTSHIVELQYCRNQFLTLISVFRLLLNNLEISTLYTVLENDPL